MPLLRVPGVGPDIGRCTNCVSTVVVFLQPNDGFVTCHIGGQVDADATYGVMQDAVDEKCHICHKYTDPVRVRSLCNCPLQDV